MYADHILHGTTFSQTTLATALCSFSDLKYKHLRRPLPPSSFLSFFFPRACHSILFCLPHSLTHPPFPLTNSLLCLVLQARRCCRHDGQGCQRWACPGCRRQGCCTSHILALDVFLVFSLIPFVCLFVCLFVLFVCLFVLFVFFFCLFAFPAKHGCFPRHTQPSLPAAATPDLCGNSCASCWLQTQTPLWTRVCIKRKRQSAGTSCSSLVCSLKRSVADCNLA